MNDGSNATCRRSKVDRVVGRFFLLIRIYLSLFCLLSLQPFILLLLMRNMIDLYLVNFAVGHLNFPCSLPSSELVHTSQEISRTFSDIISLMVLIIVFLSKEVRESIDCRRCNNIIQSLYFQCQIELTERGSVTCGVLHPVIKHLHNLIFFIVYCILGILLPVCSCCCCCFCCIFF